MRIILIGASGHGRVCAEIAELMRYEEVVFLDLDPKMKEYAGYRVIGVEDDLEKLVNEDTAFFVSIGKNEKRDRIHNRIRAAGGRIATLIHPAATIGEDVSIGEGTVVMAGAIINPGTRIGEGCIINTSASVDHDCDVGKYSHVAVGAHLCGNVTTGDHVWIGAGATVINNMSICKDVMIGAGSVVIRSIKDGGTYFGVPASKKAVS